MKPRSDRHTFGLLLVTTLVIAGVLAALVPTADAGVLSTAATQTNTDLDKKIFVRCPQGTTATGGGAQIFVSGNPKPVQLGHLTITQVVPSQSLDGYAARAQATVALRNLKWHLTAYVICQ